MERLTNSDKEIPTLVNNAEYWLKVYFKLKDIEDAEEHGRYGIWIPVSERLPEGDSGDYPINMVALDTGEVCIGVYRHDSKDWWTRMNEGETLYSTDHVVVAWMPLPEPYRESEPHKQTKADEIRSMTDEELADFIINFDNHFGEEYEGEQSCLSWLQKESEEQ